MSKRLAWLLLTPALLCVFVVAIFPISYALFLSLTDRNLARPGVSHFVGVSNYATVLQDRFWWQALATTIIITVVSVGCEFGLGFIIALLMRRATRFPALIRTAVLIPYGIVTVVSSYSWLYAWTPKTGYIAHLLPGDTTVFNSYWSSLAVICIAEIWKTTPFLSLILLSGMALIPTDILVAATLDGANAWQRLTRIIIPMIKPAITVGLIFRSLDAFRIFDNIYILTSGNNSTYSLAILGYDNLFQTFNIGLGSTISMMIFVCAVLLSLIVYFMITMRRAWFVSLLRRKS